MMNVAAGRVEVTYFTDPLCCWSWAMEPQWRRFRFEFRDHVQWRYCMSGLLPAWNQFQDSTHAVSRPAQMGPLWMEASHLSGMPINSALWALAPPASSYPACIAVKCAEAQSFDAGENYLRLLREAIMLRGKNIAEVPVLFEVADQLADTIPSLLDAERFRQEWESKKGIDAFRKDLADVRSKNIKRFPSLLFRRQDKAPMLLQGYRPYAVWLQLMQQLSPECKPRGASSTEEYKSYWLHTLEREEEELTLQSRPQNLESSSS
jgi:putative protein-disulfide isomerase